MQNENSPHIEVNVVGSQSDRLGVILNGLWVFLNVVVDVAFRTTT